MVDRLVSELRRLDAFSLTLFRLSTGFEDSYLFSAGVYGGGGTFGFCGGVVVRLGIGADSREEFSVDRLGGGVVVRLGIGADSREEFSVGRLGGGGKLVCLIEEAGSRETTCSRPSDS